MSRAPGSRMVSKRSLVPGSSARSGTSASLLTVATGGRELHAGPPGSADVSIGTVPVRVGSGASSVLARGGEEQDVTRIVLTEFISLDGIMEEPRWTFQFERGPEGMNFKSEELFGSDALLLGRVTYQGFAQAWPSMGTDDFGKRMNSIPKYVVSATLADSDATWGPTTVLRGDPVAEITRLK